MNPWPVEADLSRGSSAPSGPRRPGRHAEVRAQRRAGHPRARERTRDGREGGRRRARQGAPARTRRRDPLARDCRSRRSPRRAATILPSPISTPSTSRRCAVWTATPRARWSPRSTRLRQANESLGGVFEVRAFGLVPGLGSHVSWEERLDGRLAQAVVSIQAIKAVSIGDGFEVAGLPGSLAHDEIFYDQAHGYPPPHQPRRRDRGGHEQRADRSSYAAR